MQVIKVPGREADNQGIGDIGGEVEGFVEIGVVVPQTSSARRSVRLRVRSQSL